MAKGSGTTVLKILLVAAVVFFAAWKPGLGAEASEPSATRKTELEELLRQDCGSCHGMTLKGGLGPALLAERLEVFEDEDLYQVIMEGRPGTPMPPWETLLSEEDARWLVKLLRRAQ